MKWRCGCVRSDDGYEDPPKQERFAPGTLDTRHWQPSERSSIAQLVLAPSRARQVRVGWIVDVGLHYRRIHPHPFARCDLVFLGDLHHPPVQLFDHLRPLILACSRPDTHWKSAVSEHVAVENRPTGRIDHAIAITGSA